MRQWPAMMVFWHAPWTQASVVQLFLSSHWLLLVQVAHLPPLQVPLVQAGPLPHRHTPPTQESDVPPQAGPLPHLHAPAVQVSVVPEQGPDDPQRHFPLVQESAVFESQATQASPPAPQADSEGDLMQDPSWQHPSGQSLVPQS